MNIANSLSFFVFGLIMRLLPVFAPTVVATDAASIAEAEATTRGLWLVSMGYVVGVIGLWFLSKEILRRSVTAVSNLHLRDQLQAFREARALARSRANHARTVAARIAVRVQY